MTLRLRVDDGVCQGHGLCHREAPEVFELRESDGLAVVILDPIPAELAGPARRAQDGCPEQAIVEMAGAADR